MSKLWPQESFPRGARTGPTAATVKYNAWELSKVAEYHNADQDGTYCERVDDNEDRTTDPGFIRYLWTIYGHIPGQGAEAIGDFETEEHAMSVYLRLPDLKEKP